jgi:hypothetical protein
LARIFGANFWREFCENLNHFFGRSSNHTSLDEARMHEMQARHERSASERTNFDAVKKTYVGKPKAPTLRVSLGGSCHQGDQIGRKFAQ